MKICFWIGNAYYRKGGTSKIVSTIANELAKQHEVSLLITNIPNKKASFIYNESITIIKFNAAKVVYEQEKNSPSSLINSSIRVYNNKTGFFNTPQRCEIMKNAYYPSDHLNTFIDFFSNKSYDAIIATGQEILWLAILSEKLNPTVKTIGWQHNSYSAYTNRKGFMFWNKEELLKKYIPNLHNLVVLNAYDEEAYITNLGIKPLCINNALTLKSDIKADASKKQFFMAGRFTKQKGIFLLIEAFRLFCQHNQEWTLVIAGTGKLRKKIIEKIWEYKIQDRVHLVGFTKNMQKYYLDSSIYLMTSRYEGWGLVVTEAFEMGLPVIAFDITPMDLIIDTGENGVIVPKYNVKKYAAAMLKLANDDSMRKRMSESAITKAKHYELDKIVDEWNALLRARTNSKIAKKKKKKNEK